jgi:predicted alpha/beta-hydrolase family hydrolase
MTIQAWTEFADVSDKNATVRGYLHGQVEAGRDCLVLTHGAGADCRSPLLTALAEAFQAAGVTVLRCDLPFRQARPHGPPLRTAEKDQAGLRAAVESLRRRGAGRVFLGGHSYGGRQASMLAASEPEVAKALLLLSYPLHPPKQPENLRTQHLPSLQVPALFVHGTCDGFGTIAEMEAALQLIPARTELLAVDGAGHELLKKSNREQLMEQVSSRFLAFARASA